MGLKIFSLIVALVFAVGCETAATTAKNETPATKAAPPTAVQPANAPQQAAPAETPLDDAPRITLADAKAAFDAGSAIFIDSRAESAYKGEHIKGAINIPLGSLDFSKVPKNKKIIVYCS